MELNKKETFTTMLEKNEELPVPPTQEHPREHLTQIVFGPGGVIAKVKKNQHLLLQIADAKPLSAKPLLHLAAFYRPNPTLTQLADHLILNALLLLKLSDDDGGDLWDEAEDALRGEVDWEGIPVDPEDKQEIEKQRAQLGQKAIFVHSTSIKWILFQGIGILVETNKVPDSEDSLHTLIGFSPDPKGLR